MRIKIKSVIFSAVVLLLFLSLTPAQADILYDHFDYDKNYFEQKSGWQPSGSNWVYDVSGSYLTVTDITSSGNSYSKVTLSQNFTPLSNDFSFDFVFSWDSENSNNAIQTIYLSLYSDTTLIAKVGYLDAWTGRNGTMYASVAGNSEPNYNTTTYLSSSGDASVSIDRIDDSITIVWGEGGSEINLKSGYSNASVNKAVLEFGYYTATGAFFGTESVDLVADPVPTNVPEPATMLLLGFGLAGLAGLKRRIRKD